MNVFYIGTKKYVIFLVILLCISLVGCNKPKDIDEDVDKVEEELVNEEDMIRISNELTSIMVLENDFATMEQKFSEYKDIINEITYEKYFNTLNRISAALYYKDGESKEFVVLEKVHSIDKDREGNRIDNIYIIYKYKLTFIDSELNDEEITDIDYIDVEGVNKFMFKEGKIVNFEKIL